MKVSIIEKTPLLLEGELLIEKVEKAIDCEVTIRILDVTFIDDVSITLAESICILKLKKGQTKLAFQVFGPEPDLQRRYIAMATVFHNFKKGHQKTLYRTTQSIPVLTNGYPQLIVIPMTKM